MKLTEEIDSIIDWLTETDGGHAVEEGNIKCAVSDLRTLKQAFDKLAYEAKHEKPQGIQWNKYPEVKPIKEAKYLAYDLEGTIMVLTWLPRMHGSVVMWSVVTHWAEINLPNQ